MKRLVSILCTLVLFLSTADAANIYVSKAGSNTSPYDTWAKAATHPNRLNSVTAAGDSVLIGGGTFDTTYILPPTGGTAKTVYVCSTLVDRGTTTLSSGWTLTGTWSVSSGSIYVYDATIPARWNAWQADDHDWACVTENGRVLQMVTSTEAMTAAGYAYYNHTTNTLYVRTRGGGSPAGYTIRFSQAPVVNFQTASQDSVIFDHLTFDMGVQGVIVLGSSNSSGIPSAVEIKNCNIRNAGCASPLQNNALVYCGNPGIVSDADLGQYLRMINDTLQYSTGDLSDLSEHMGSGLDMYSMENVLCSALVVMDLNGTGINWKNGYSANVDIDNCVVMDCKISNTMYGMRIGPHCDSMIVAGNQFINCTARGIAVYASSGTSYASGRVYLLNNTLYNIPEPFMISPISTGNNRIAYNVVFDTTSRNYSIRFDVQGGEASAQTPYTETYWDIDSNMYYHGGSAFTCTFTDNNATCTGTNWTAWQACGFDGNGLNTTNPNFTASQTPTLTRPSASGEMSYAYLGRTWEIFGALQNVADTCPDTLVAPILETPANGATGQQNSVILDWSDSTQVGSPTVYDLQVDNNSNFGSLTFSSSPTDSRDTVTATLAHLTTYYWRVRSRSDCDTSAWSDSRTFTVDNYSWTMPAKRDNPLNTWLDSNSTLDDHTIYLCGMDAATPPDADTLGIRAKWKVIIWSAGGDGATEYGAMDAVKLKQYDSTTKLILYSSLDHGLQTTALAIDTSDAGGNIDWNGMTDEYSHYKAVATDSSKNYYSLFYHFAEATKILLYPSLRSGYYRFDTVAFEAATLPISDDDSNSVVPDFYSSTFFTSYGTIALTDADTIEGGTTDTIKARWDYIGTPAGGKVTRVYPDFSNPLARYADLKYQTRVFATDYNNLGGTGDNVYGWGAMSDSGFSWDGIYLDNSGDHQISPPEGSTLISGGNIRNSTGVIGSWYADTTLNKMNADMKTYFAYLTDYCNNSANFADGKPRATAANFGTWTTWLSSRNGVRQWYNDSNRINLKLIENSYLDGGYSSYNAYEATNGMGRTISDLSTMDSLARANDFYVMFSGRVNQIDTSVASGYSDRIKPFLRSNWVRAKTALGYRGLFAVQPIFAVDAINWQPCNSGGFSYQGLNYSPYCNDRSEVDSFVTRCTLPFMYNYDLGKEITDSAVTVTLTDQGASTPVSVYKTFWRDVTGTDTTYTWMYYYPRKQSSWDLRPTANHYVLINPPPVNFKRLGYDGTLTTISGAAQSCYIGDQLILSYSTATPYVEPSKNTIRGTILKGVTIK